MLQNVFRQIPEDPLRDLQDRDQGAGLGLVLGNHFVQPFK